MLLDQADAASTPEWKYVPVRRTQGAESDDADESGYGVSASNDYHDDTSQAARATIDYTYGDGFQVEPGVM